MKKYLPYLIALILGFLWLRQCSETKSLKSENEILESKSDTVFKRDTLKIPKPYPIYLKPEKVIIYKTDTTRVPYKEVKIVRDTIVLLSPETNPLKVNKQFLLQYPTSSKLVSFDLSHSKLQLDLLSIDGVISRNSYPLDFNRYNYRYSDNKMTVKKKRVLKVEPDISYSFRPLNNLHDLTFQLKFKTSKFSYNLGINTFLYPKFQQNFGYDAQVGISYNFK